MAYKYLDENGLLYTLTLLAGEFDTKANLASPAFTGTPTSTTPATSDNSTRIATTAYVKSNLPTVNNGTLTIKQGTTTLGTFTANQSTSTTVTLPANATVNDATITIKKNGTTVGDFTTNQAGNEDINITVPTAVSDLSDAADYVKDTDLAAVATSGDYDDLTNKPSIPTVNNATLTIQKNGTNVATFTANSATGATANITVPTTVAQLTDASSYYTSAQTDAAIASAIGDLEGVEFVIVQTLPATGEKSKIYLVPSANATGDAYDEYIWITSTSSFEKIGNTDVDLSGYVLRTDMVTITNSEIDTIWTNAGF